MCNKVNFECCCVVFWHNETLTLWYPRKFNYIYKLNDCIMNDESWDYYLATGEDPTGGRIGPDFDHDTGEYLEEDEDA